MLANEDDEEEKMTVVEPKTPKVVEPEATSFDETEGCLIHMN